ITGSLGFVKAPIQLISDGLSVDGALKLFNKGNILVTNVLFPEYYEVISMSSGIIAEVNSLLSHVAIIARELGIPCVLNIPMSIIARYSRDGDILIVDGNKGTVIIPNPRFNPNLLSNLNIESKTIKEISLKLDTIVKDKFNILKKTIESENIIEFRNIIKEIIDDMYKLAENRPQDSKNIFFSLCSFLQVEFFEIIKKKYSPNEIFNALIRVDEKNEPVSVLEKLYFEIKQWISKLDFLKYKEKHFYEM
ncbi:MAG: PEP-utilizing enzyme, partial [Candidatus Helarchaeota archaeon]